MIEIARYLVLLVCGFLIFIHGYYLFSTYRLKRFLVTTLKTYNTYPSDIEFYLFGNTRIKANIRLRGYGAVVVEYDSNDKRVEVVYVDDNNLESFWIDIIPIGKIYKKLYFNSIKKIIEEL